MNELEGESGEVSFILTVKHKNGEVETLEMTGKVEDKPDADALPAGA